MQKEIPIKIKDSQSNLEKIKAELARYQARLNQFQTHIQQIQARKANISFIMPAYNCADTIEESINSIFNGNFTDGDELIIVNDGSTDHTAKVLEKLRRNYPSIKVFHHPQNRGGAPARNMAVSHVKHSIIFCLDSDNILVPGTVPKLKEFMFTSGADVAVFKEKRFFTERIENYAEGNKWEFKDITTLDDALKTHIFPGASGNYMFTKKSWMRAGGYPELTGYDTHGFGLRQLATGAKMVSMPDSYYYHRQGWESYYIRYSKEHNISLEMAQVLLPFKHLISDQDISYIWGEGKEIWYSEVLESRPISLIESNPCYPSELFYPSWGDISPPVLPVVITMSTLDTNGGGS
ncbi:glycosyl transferase family 2 [Microcoleus vaginatus FGP-2]|nr:glycosyl transferase family 2 [Microcoleus vaginatus FGP-2]